MSDIAPGWPCALLPTVPPSVADRLSAPTADDILPQLLQLTPRGPAWGTDEAGDGRGASAIMLGVWRAIAGRAANNYKIEFDLATQCFPSAVTYSLADWESEYGLPNPCVSGTAGTAQRIAALRAKFGAVGGQSPAYFICLAASLGYDITIDEPGQFLCDVGECVGTGTYEGFFHCDDDVCVGEAANAGSASTTDPDPSELPGRLEYFELDSDPDDDPDNEVSDETCWKYWVVRVGTTGFTWFYPDDGECDSDPLEGFLPATDLECELQRLCPPHTKLVFDYGALLVQGALDFSNSLNSNLLLLL